MAITKLVLDRQAAGRVFTFGSSAASADVNLAKATGDSAATVVLTAEGSVDVRGNVVTGGSLSVAGTATLEGGVNMSGSYIHNVHAPSAGTDAANKNYVDTAVTDATSGLATDISTLQSNMSTAQSDISSLESSVSSINSSITTIQNDVNTAEGNISSLTGDVSALQSQVGTIESNVNSLQDEVSNVHNTVDNLTLEVGSISNSLTGFASLNGGNTFSGSQEFAGSVTVRGNMTVTGTTTTVDSTTVDLGTSVINLNGTGASFGGLVINDPTAPNVVSGSLLWDTTNDKWIAGPLGSEKTVLTANLGTEGQVATMVNGVVTFATPAVQVAYKRASVSGTKNGTNKVFTITTGDNMVANSEQVILNGIILMPGAGNDYQISGNTITFSAGFPAPLSDDNLQVFATY